MPQSGKNYNLGNQFSIRATGNANYNISTEIQSTFLFFIIFKYLRRGGRVVFALILMIKNIFC